MSDTPQGPGWWQASDGKWYPPEQFTGTAPTQQPSDPQSWSPDAVYQPSPQAPYGQVGYGYGAMPPRNESLAVVSLVVGICAIVFGCCYLGLPLGITGMITGYLGRTKIEESNGSLTGSGLALAGMICGAVGVGLGVLQIVFLLIGATTSPT